MSLRASDPVLRENVYMIEGFTSLIRGKCPLESPE